ncbi:hypothetical protein [Nisaea sp.]|uniref:hypothetical protein n=1 Tax=Nisaea sp. TaxID=2024842 RepID=UPI0032EE9DC0
MEEEIDDLVRRLVRLEDELERKLEAQRDRFRYRLEEKRAVFEESVDRQHRLLKTGIVTFLRRSPLASLVVAPAVYGLIIPVALLDLAVCIFQLVCFTAWGMERVRRADHVIVDRHRLAYLNGIEKLNCWYCGYANGVIGFAREVASRTEQYWCPIKHALRVRGRHSRYRQFVEYGDAEGFRAQLETLRDKVRKTPETRLEKPDPDD